MTTSTLTGLEVGERCAALEVGTAEYYGRFVQSDGAEDVRICSHLMTDSPGAIRRLGRWLNAGKPAPDFAALAFMGSDEVRALVLDTLRRVPHPVAWDALRGCYFVEVGRAANGYHGTPRLPAPADDVVRVIALRGDLPDDELAAVLAHELGHHHRSEPIAPQAPRHDTPPGTVEAFAVAEGIAPKLVSLRDREEQGADDLARLWGFPLPRRDYRDYFQREIHARAKGAP